MFDPLHPCLNGTTRCVRSFRSARRGPPKRLWSQTPPGAARYLWESRLQELTAESPSTCRCLYEARLFSTGDGHAAHGDGR